jgi:hypothetical protein
MAGMSFPPNQIVAAVLVLSAYFWPHYRRGSRDAEMALARTTPYRSDGGSFRLRFSSAKNASDNLRLTTTS